MGKKKKLSSMNLERYSYKEIAHEDVKVRCRILIVCEGEKTEPNYFKSFDQMQYGIDCAWSNEAFELWYVFHFVNRVTAMNREEYKKAISKYVNESQVYKVKYAYQKNDPKSRMIMTTYGDEARAIRYAQSQSDSFDDTRYATHNPCTTVYKLVRLLRGEDKEFNKRIIADLDI